MRISAPLLIVFSLSACAETASETPSSFTYQGTTYPAVLREFVRSDGSTYQRRVVSYGSGKVSCSATDDLACVAAIRDRNSGNDR